jgi:hypothetical protein
MAKYCILVVLAASLLLGFGCVKNYRITQPLEQPLGQGSRCEIGTISDALPQDYKEEDKPSSEFIAKLRGSLIKEIVERELFASVSEDLAEAEYELSGSVLDYKKGSGFLRFLFGALAGSSKLTVELNLADKSTGTILFSGNFTQQVTGWPEESDATCKKLAKDFAKALQKELKRLAKLEKE